jgi:hypothetical protein
VKNEEEAQGDGSSIVTLFICEEIRQGVEFRKSNYNLYATMLPLIRYKNSDIAIPSVDLDFPGKNRILRAQIV